MSVEVRCPGCGAQVVFRIPGSMVAVCEYCKSVVARTDRGVEDMGKVADIVQTQSPLHLGLKGAYQKTWFELTGRAQLGHEAGGFWDEWYAAFSDGRWGWLAEAQGRFYMTFQVAIPPEENHLPSLEGVELGHGVPALPGLISMMVAEKGEAQAIAAQGEIPYVLAPGQTYEYADISGAHGEFGTIDYSEQPPLLFLGKEVTLAELGFPELAAAQQEARQVAGVQLTCPHCRGPLDLHAPDYAQRVTCPNCGSLLDVNSGRLAFLNTLAPGKVTPVIPLGTKGELQGGSYMVIGFMQRSVEIDHVRYYWEEYLLYDPKIAFRWLVRSDDHWDFVDPVLPGAVKAGEKFATYKTDSFRLYQTGIARADYVLGEFYWKVTTGELVGTADFVHPPYVLSREVSAPVQAQISSHRHHASESGEINWSLGTHLSPQTVEKAFGIKGLPRTSKPAPNEVFPYTSVYKYWAWMLLATLIIGIAINVMGPRKKVFEQSYALQPLANPGATQVIFTDPFQLEGDRNIKVTATANLSNTWLYIDGDFVSDATGLVQTFPLEVDYYFGSDSDGSWSEGGPTSEVHVSSLPADKYTMRMEVSWEHWQQPMNVIVTVEQGVPRLLHMFLAMLVISVFPILLLIYHIIFARRRWEDSPYSPYQNR
ncbi:MAG TPA: DUF4178 domain-containing protein [Blastocatellia bacterium]